MSAVTHWKFTVPNLTSVVSFTMNGLVRVPALLTNCAAISVAGELAIRALSGTAYYVGIEFRKGGPLEWVATKFSETHIRSYQNKKDFPWTNLLQKFAIFSALSIVSNEFARVVCGDLPPIYNRVLEYLGPFLIRPKGSYLHHVTSQKPIPPLVGVPGGWLNGLARVPALLATIAAITIAGELVIRGISALAHRLIGKPNRDTLIGKAVTFVTDSSIRGYQDEKKYTWYNLMQKMVICATFGIVATELARLALGPIHPIYNWVFTYIGPFVASAAPHPLTRLISNR